MRRVIGGKVYNSHTATELHKADYRHLGEDSWCQERLYETKDGDHFIIGIGGPLTRWNDESGMVALNDTQTRHWLKKHDKAGPGWMQDKEVTEIEQSDLDAVDFALNSDGTAYIGFYAPADQKVGFKRAAELESMSVSELLCLLVRAYNVTGKVPGGA